MIMSSFLHQLISKKTIFSFLFFFVSSFILISFFTTKDFLHSTVTSLFYDNSEIYLLNNLTKDGKNILLLNKELSLNWGGREF